MGSQPPLPTRFPTEIPTTEASPGVYVRPGAHQEVDALWSGSRSYFRDDRSGMFLLVLGLIIGAGLTFLAIWLLGFRQPPAMSTSQVSSPAPVRVMPAQLKPDHLYVRVRNGDSLSQIADREYHNTAKSVQDSILIKNHLMFSDRVQSGQTLALPVIANPMTGNSAAEPGEHR